MVLLNNQHINKKVQKGVLGGAMCTCQDCQEYRNIEDCTGLRDCPFCGGQPNIKSIDHKNVDGFELGCKWIECTVSPYVMATTIAQCKERWNKRKESK